MAKNTSRSMRGDLLDGTVDGKYIRERPDTAVSSMNAAGDRLIRQNRQALNPLDGFMAAEAPVQINPAGN